MIFIKNKIFKPSFYRIGFYILFFFFSSCSRKPLFYKKSIDDLQKITLFIQMPTNKMVFNNISSIVYDGLYNQFDSVGFNLVSDSNVDFVFKTDVKIIGNDNKIISPDVLVYGFRIKLVIVCELYFQQRLIKKKKFFFYRLLYKPIDPALIDTFLDFEYKWLIQKASVKIDQYFRPYFFRNSRQ